MLSRIIVCLSIVVSLLAVFTVLSRAEGLPHEQPQLTSADLEEGLLLLKALPVCVVHGIDIKHARQLDLEHPDFGEWNRVIDDILFVEQDVAMTQLWFNLSLVAYYGRTGAIVSGQLLLQTIFEHPHFSQACGLYYSIYIEC